MAFNVSGALSAIARANDIASASISSFPATGVHAADIISARCRDALRRMKDQQGEGPNTRSMRLMPRGS